MDRSTSVASSNILLLDSQQLNDPAITQYPDAPDIESSTQEYAARFAGEVGDWMLLEQEKATEEAIERFFPEQHALQVLDVGGGHGQNVGLMKRLGHQLTIVGSTLESGELIRKEVEAGNLRFTVAPLLALPYEDNAFDLVICYRILSHMASWQALIAELGRVSRHIVLVDYPARKSFNSVSSALFSIKKKIEKNTRRFGIFSDHQIDRAFEDVGYQRQFRHRQFFLPMALDRLINSPGFSKRAAGVFRSTGLTDRFGSPVIVGYCEREQ